MSHQFYVTLPSDSSFAYYSDNTAAKYMTKLIEPLYLDGVYEVGIAEIMYTKSLFNFNNADGAYWVGIIPYGSRKLTRCIFRSGYYATAEDFVRDLNKQMDDTFEKDENYKVSFQVNKMSGMIAIVINQKNENIKSFLCSSRFLCRLGYDEEYLIPNEGECMLPLNDSI